MKNIIKEICITILLCVAVVLIFAIVFYDYVPISKVVPNKVAYAPPEDVKTELNEDVTIQETQPKQITYSVTSSDLKQYQSATVYQPGNPNPFRPYSTDNNNTILDNTIGTTANGGNSFENGIQYYYPSSSGSSSK